jgi:excisionase family DNA binding protein
MASDEPGIDANDAGKGPFLEGMARQVNLMRKVYADQERVTLDFLFLCFLNECSQLGRFTYGPITIETRVVEDLFERSYVRVAPGEQPKTGHDEAALRFYRVLSEGLAKSGRRRIDELHYLLAFMRVGVGLPARVFGELGVKPDEVERFAHGETRPPRQSPGRERLLSPEEVAEYLGVHVQTVRAWIRGGKLPARRLAGQRALRIRESDLEAVLEPVDSTAFEREPAEETKQ